MQGDPIGKKLARESHNLLGRIVKERAGTPWEVLARRQKLIPLGLAWQPAR
jgi:CubicO group peptidase (beta-lactamase class C family)